MIIIGNVHAGSVIIYKLKSYYAFTEREDKLHKSKDYATLYEEIKKNTEIRKIDGKYLKYEKNQISVFEGDVIRLALADRGLSKADYQLLDEIVYMEIYHNEIMEQIIKKGVMIADKKYVFYSASTGQVRNKTITLLEEDFYKKHKDKLLVGLSVDHINNLGGMNVGKYISYTALPLSSSVLPDKEIDIDRCILVKGLETTVTDMVKFVDIREDSNGQHYVFDTPTDYLEKSIKIEHTDGAGMFLPGELPSSCQIRSGYFKGAMFPFDFRAFTKEIAQNTVVIDAWGKEIDIEQEDIRFIFTTSQLKMWKMYSSWDAYKEAFKNSKIKISINSYANPPKEIVNSAYQYLQALPYGSSIEGICGKAKDDIKKMYTDLEYTKEVMGFTVDEEECPDKKTTTNALIAEALNIYPQLIYDSYIQDKVNAFVKARAKSYRAGKIPLKGYYSYAAPDMYAFCEYLFCGEENPQGLVPKNHVYNKYFDDKGTVEHLVCLRSPHLSNYEYGKRDLVKTEECRKWFKHMESDTVVSCHDLLSKNLQLDWDGDEILVCDDEELYKLAQDKPSAPLYYEMQQAEPQLITDEAIYETLVKGFDNNVIGESSNAITKLWNTPIATNDNPTPYDDAINVFCAFSNYSIDYPKTGKSLDLGKYQELYNKLVVPKKGFVKSEVPHPNFFAEAKGKKKSKVASPTDSVMDRIKNYIGIKKGSPDYLLDTEGNDFDYRMLMNNEQREDGSAMYEVNRYDSKYKQLYLMLKLRKKAEINTCKNIGKSLKKQNTNSVKIAGQYEIFYYHCIREIKSIFTNNDGWFNSNLAVNYFIDLEYLNPEFATSSKNILWKCFGHILVDNLQKNVNGEIVIKHRPRMAYAKAQEGVETLDKMLDEKLKPRTINITSDDLSFIHSSLQKHKNGKPYKNDMEILYILYCLYKDAKTHDRLQDGYYIITQRKHFIEYNPNNNTRKKRRVWLNMNRVLNMAEVKSYEGSLKRFNEMPGITIINDKEKERYRIKFDMPTNDSKTLFEVGNIYNAMIYLKAYTQGKKLLPCKICGKDFIKQSNNQKTCSVECQNELHKLNQARTNERNRKAALEAKQVII